MRHRIPRVGVLLIAGTAACIPASKTRSLVSKKGDSRFYLAYVETAQKLPDSSRTVGQDMIVGLACYGEPKDRSKPISVPADHCGKGTKDIHRDARTKLHEFTLDENPQAKGGGACKVILGNKDLIELAQRNPRELAVGKSATLLNATMRSVTQCAITLGSMFVVNKVFGAAASSLGWRRTPAVGSGRGPTGNTGAGAAAGTGAAAGGVAVAPPPPGTWGGLPSQFVTQVQGNWFQQVFGNLSKNVNFSWMVGWIPILGQLATSNQYVKLGFTLLPCAVQTTGNVFDVLKQRSRNSQRILFWDSIAKADKLAGEDLNSSSDKKEFDAQVASHRVRPAAALKGPRVVAMFNSKVEGTYKANFVDEVIAIDREINGIDESAPSAAPASDATPASATGKPAESTAPRTSP